MPAPSGYGHGRANSRPAGFADHFRLQGRRLARRTAAAPSRFDEAAKRMDVGQLCGGVGSLSAMGSQALAVQKRFLARLGLREPDMSWTASRDLLAEWAHLLVLSAGTADRIGHEVYNLQRDEIGELRERSLPRASAASPCRTSATRRRPNISERWRAWCGPMPGSWPKSRARPRARREIMEGGMACRAGTIHGGGQGA